MKNEKFKKKLKRIDLIILVLTLASTFFCIAMIAFLIVLINQQV